jgi:hypothetical protein
MQWRELLSLEWFSAADLDAAALQAPRWSGEHACS